MYDLAGNLLAETNASNVITRYYIYGLGLLALVDSTDHVVNYHFDGTGNTVALTDSAQNIIKAYAYEPYGKITDEQGGGTQPFTYVGQYGIMRESGSNFYYMRARYYDPEAGRFISEDPVGFDGGQVNLYAYVASNPIMNIDPTGLAVGDWWDLPANYGRAQEIANEEIRRFGPSHNDLGDAMRHSIWSRRIVEETNVFTAWSAGVVHEAQNLIQGSPVAEIRMDLHNNQVGRQSVAHNQSININDLRINPGNSNGSYNGNYIGNNSNQSSGK